ncbi:MAG: hypothetical protein HKN21_14800 [Candidatus Eisenbacteria bacterium]|uniref:DUF2007 domain-containing protein n=1 Tax=Eiseniibacteriota bacterium TaxID=2212470 RepID=A0A7Y2H3G6_UNCEI|nr:hypothetical protein [Candidatus Eisenbacteria bacterium]
MSENQVVVATFAGEIEAELAKGSLEAAGIEATIAKDDCGGMRPELQFSGGVSLLVHQNVAEEARRILTTPSEPAP